MDHAGERMGWEEVFERGYGKSEEERQTEQRVLLLTRYKTTRGSRNPGLCMVPVRTHARTKERVSEYRLLSRKNRWEN